MKILVVRNDKLGDFMLAWPVFALLRHYLPEANITALVPEYTSPIAEICPWIDQVLVDTGGSPLDMAMKMRRLHFDAMLSLFSTTRVALSGLLAGLPYRLAPATKLAQVVYNHRLVQRRSRSEKPEYAYNLDLAWKMLFDLGAIPSSKHSQENHGDWLPPELSRPLLSVTDNSDSIRHDFRKTHGLTDDQRLVFIHPGSGGSANTLRARQYSQLANRIRSLKGNTTFVITAGPGELALAREVTAGINAPCTVYESNQGLLEFVRTLQCADLFIGASSGPLHIAGALNLNTAAFYPGHRSATPLRWQTLNAPERRLAFIPPVETARLVDTIDIDQAAMDICAHFFDLASNPHLAAK